MGDRGPVHPSKPICGQTLTLAGGSFGWEVFGDREGVIRRTVQAQTKLQPQNSLIKRVPNFFGSSAMLLKDRMKDKIVDQSHRAL